MGENSYDKCIGAYIGAAIGDAMGGPVECNHYKRIKKLVGEVDGLLPYKKPYTLIDLQPGYALHSNPGSVTDDTFCRKDITKFYLETEKPRTPEKLASWLLENAELDEQWPDIMVEPLYQIRDDELSIKEIGRNFKQGGGIGWWTPIGIVNAGNPEKAAEEVRYLSQIWKAPLEQDLLAGFVAAIAEGINENATYKSMIDSMFNQCTGSLSRKLLQRAIDIAENAEDVWDLADKLYNNILMPGHDISPYKEINEYDPPIEVDAPMPPKVKPVEYTDKTYTSCFFAEQIPLALAAFVFEEGRIKAIPTCVNLGRDNDTTATTVGGWVGALHGESGLPNEWVDTVCKANINEMDIRKLAEDLCKLNK